ncbi:MAG: cobaltochelatase subunit CobN, partial [Rhodothermaceae bacterium]
MKKIIKKILLILLAVITVSGIYFTYSVYIAPTKIALINFNDPFYADIIEANDNSFISIDKIKVKGDGLQSLNSYDAIFVFGMGLRLNEKQKQIFKEAEENGVYIYLYATSAGLKLSNLGGDDLAYIEKCMMNSGSKNFAKMLNYSRRILDGKTLFSDEVTEPTKIPTNFYFHHGEEDIFTNYGEYLDFYKSSGKYDPEKPRVLLVTSNLGPKTPNSRGPADGLLKEMESKGYNVFPIAGFTKRFQFIKEVNPDLVVHIPHGRFAAIQADSTLKYLRDNNIPVLCPIIIYDDHDKWVKEQKGMSGGLLSQSIIAPELDGGIVPYVTAAMYKNENGYMIYQSIPERTATFVNMVDKYIRLKQKPNKDKKLAVVYFKGPGLNAMVAAGLEISPSLLNMLKELKKAGYTTGKLPSNSKELYKLIQKEGRVLGAYAKGKIEEYLKNGNPSLVPADSLSKWMKEDLHPDMITEVKNLYGDLPGDYMNVIKNGNDYIAVAKVQFGNVVLVPQPMPATGSNEFQLIHGARKAPPYPYLATYFWIRNQFKADAIMHFGTHGSFEFTPWKQVGLSNYDWADALLGDLPHGYYYVINNVGEGMIAKRRSYAELVTHLTPPFVESGLEDKMAILNSKLNEYLATNNIKLKDKYTEEIKSLMMQNNIHKDLAMDDFEKREMVKDDFDKLETYLHTVGREKIQSGLYSLGERYTKKEIIETTRMLAVDPVAYSMANLDKMKNKITQKEIDDVVYFDQHYRKKSLQMIDAVLKKGVSPEKYISKTDLQKLDEWKQSQKYKDENVFFASMMLMWEATIDNLGNEKEKVKKDESKIKELVLKIAPYDEKKKLILETKSDERFKKITSLSNPRTLNKARKMAKFIPAMKKQIELAAAPEIIKLVALMQNEENRKLTYQFLSDEDLMESIKSEKEKIEKSIIDDMFVTSKKEKLFLIFNGKDFAKQIADYSEEKLNELKLTFKFYQDNIKLADKIEESSPDRKALKKILTGDQALVKIKDSEKVIDKKLNAIKEKKKEYFTALDDYWTTLKSIHNYYDALKYSPDKEVESIINALNGGYIKPSSGGDPIFNPQAIPTGRNMYAINAERTPTEEAWKLGVEMADQIIENHKKKNGQYPRKVAYTLWGGEFIRGQGSTVAQIFYLLGVEPVRNAVGTVQGVKLIPSEKLGRPRIDVMVQTSGQFRDFAASRIFLINKAVKIASEAENDKYPNYVKDGTLKAEEVMKTSGLSPKDAQLYSTSRVFGGVNGNYGTGIMGLVEAGDKWEDEKEITQQYLQNMGAVYTKDNWGAYIPGVMEAAIQNTEVIAHTRSSNTWGPISLDHVYEFMGGLNATIRQVTGNDPSAYFVDNRNRHHGYVQDAKEAIWVEARSTLYNSKYIKPLTEGGASSAETFAESFRNLYGWNVMKPAAVDGELWDGLYNIYVEDSKNLNLKSFFEKENPYALQEMTAVMLETVR